MRSLLYVMTTLIVMGLAFWAYRENYRTQAAINDMANVQRQIGALREELGVLRAEWAYLNRPERLRNLVNLNFDKLRLVPFGAEQFVDVGQVAFPVTRPGEAAEGPDAALTPRPPGFPPRRPQETTP
ncbi:MULTISPECIES: cell division protein FtsL [unclassified Paracoccus (in: a-proteobacteria)]|uniref:cell division protein FtsL n=1 Tax=unclassified Paracoccus (in: a-proteobacteria) TaxID=2688777 RepID=UPI0012B231E6|nr:MULTISPECIES: cell division protein FtsL [unclassified Paracoccus (in: a-proteobacteria)]UXU75260.1 cell division protein FtsL [Paracoccus sp. SMMA_5]UXU81162.1 cell division protein FtsL [Paracoccus sp. SMMA_5_TC]